MSLTKKEWQCLRSEEGPNLKLFRSRFDFMKNPRNDQTEKMVILDSEDSANVVALTTDGKIPFVRQYRFGIKDFTVELPGGLIESGEDQTLGVRRELREETGFTASNWQYLGKVPSNPVFMNSYIHHWVATEAEQTQSLQLDDGEDMELILMPVEDVRKQFWKGYFLHTHTTNALLLFFSWYDKK